MFYDLNVIYNPKDAELPRTLALLAEGYNTIALNHPITGKFPSTPTTSAIPSPLPFPPPPTLTILTRCTYTMTEPASNHRLSQLSQVYHLLALRPTDEKTLQQACTTADIDIVSIDLSQRFPTHFKFKTFSAAVERGVRIELCYSVGVGGDAVARRNLISNASQLIRATRGRGLIISSEARRALGVRAPADVVNLAVVWGLGQERGHEAVSKECRSVVKGAELRRRSYRGVVDVVYGGEKPEDKPKEEKGNQKGQAQKKRKADGLLEGTTEDSSEAPKISKRQMKKQAKLAKQQEDKNVQGSKDAVANDTPVK